MSDDSLHKFKSMNAHVSAARIVTYYK